LRIADRRIVDWGLGVAIADWLMIADCRLVIDCGWIIDRPRTFDPQSAINRQSPINIPQTTTTPHSQSAIDHPSIRTPQSAVRNRLYVDA
jgi:hypothetical protein